MAPDILSLMTKLVETGWGFFVAIVVLVVVPSLPFFLFARSTVYILRDSLKEQNQHTAELVETVKDGDKEVTSALIAHQRQAEDIQRTILTEIRNGHEQEMTLIREMQKMLSLCPTWSERNLRQYLQGKDKELTKEPTHEK